MPPKFSLQPVLDYRHRRVEAMEIELGRMMREKNRAEEKLRSFFTRQHEVLEEIRIVQEGDLDIQRIRQLYNGLRNLQKMIDNQKIILTEMMQRIEEKRKKIVNARQDEETLEILKDKEEERILVEENRKENALRDDIYIAQAYHKSQNLEQQS
ncbi:MAG: flagellar export protein FliJ [Anaerolineales bacterium]|nr:flagellar export protein FliJ [Anaerolineales bacterium]